MDYDKLLEQVLEIILQRDKWAEDKAAEIVELVKQQKEQGK